MDKSERKAAVAAFKELKIHAGIYTLRCAAADQVWVGRSANIERIENRIAFTLKNGPTGNAKLIECWREHGAQAFHFEIVERLPEDEPGYALDSLLKERHAHWLAALSAEAI